MVKLSASHWGRILLHLVAMMGDHQWAWHWAGIVRELLK